MIPDVWELEHTSLVPDKVTRCGLEISKHVSVSWVQRTLLQIKANVAYIRAQPD